MLCENCHDQEATVHLTQVVDGAVQKLHLCEQCAEASGFTVDGPMSITDLILGLGGAPPLADAGGEEHSCPRCHMSRTDFKKTGRFGCPACYETFAGDLPPLLRAVHRSEQHIGKIPAREGLRARMSAALSALQAALREAIDGERFEEAARLRDEIQACRSGNAEVEAGGAI